MESFALNSVSVPAAVAVSRFRGTSGVEECHLIVQPVERAGIETQLRWVEEAYRAALASLDLDGKSAILRRFFCSDLTNQRAALEARPFASPLSADEPCAVSWICQPPGFSAKVSLWAYHVRDPRGALEKTQQGPSLTVRRNGLSHVWTTGLTAPKSENSYDQTRAILDEYDGVLKGRNLKLADHVMRTWFFVQDIDANYQGLVKARREFFTERGLTPDTHFIASTGIGGSHADVAARVTLDAYAISGVRPEQIRFLSAPDHLSPTHTYGVTFERGTAISYRDRRHAILSGTASIDREGKIVHPGDVARQFHRTLENMEALLAPAGAALKDMAAVIAYIRDPGDYATVWATMQARFGQTPMVAALAPVCRPGWLVELEGIAIVPAANPGLPIF